MQLQPIDRKNVSNIVFDELKKMISTGEWKSGDKIPSELELTKMFGVSRVSIRAAMHKLESLGVIDRKQGLGTFVNEFIWGQPISSLSTLLILDNPTLLRLNEYRVIIECGAAELAAKYVTDANILQFEENYHKMRTTILNGEDASEIDVEFHILIAYATRNPMIIQTFELLKQTFVNCMREIKKRTGDSSSLIYHRAIIDALTNRDSTQARAVMYEHLVLNANVLAKSDFIEEI